ncbi:MAG TPA: VWA domain-containing protein [Steroidobacteraceae bacterium]|nr:VWA domain-containing protein [Steroidobacteraceae bacterium]
MNLVSHFAQPVWIAAGLAAVPVLLLLYWRFDQLQRRRVAAFSLARDTDSAHLGVARPLLWAKRLLFCGAVLAACVALARPLGAMRMEESERRGLDILFAIDTSRSMLTPDVKPDRLTRARLAVEDLLDQLSGDGVGLVAFAGEAFLQAPLTTDYDAFKESLDALDTHTIALGGTDIAAAIRLGESTLALRGDTQKVLVLITDGEDLAGDALLAAQAAAKKGMVIFTVGVGTAAGELIPIPDASGGTEFVKDPDGKFVKSRLDSDMLRQIAAATGGVYTPLGPQGQGVVRLYQERLKGLAQRQHTERQVAVYAELFQWPLAAAIALLSLAWLLGVSVRRRVPVSAPATAALFAVLVVGAVMLTAPRAWASPLTAQDEYQKGQYVQAQREYAQSLKSEPDQSHLQFNLGAAAYKAGDFATATTAFNNALKTREIPLQQSAYYNLGNALFRQGEKLVTTDPKSTLATWQQSLGAFDTALQLKPSDADAKFNRNVVKTRLDELRRQQQQQQKQNQNGQGDNKDEKNKPQDQKDQKDQKGQQSQNGQPGQQNQQQNQQGQQNQPNQQNQQNQPGQQDQQNQQSTPNQQGPRPAGPTQPQSGPRPGQDPQPGEAAAAQDIGKPDQLSRQEAEQLLDSVKGEERHLAAGVRNGKPESPAATLRDW